MTTPSHAPSASKYQEALNLIREQITAKQMQMLKVLYSVPDRTMTATELAREIGYPNHGVVNLQYGRLGHLLSDAMDWLPERRSNGSYQWWSVISSGIQTQHQGFQWTLRPELAEALVTLSWVEDAA